MVFYRKYRPQTIDELDSENVRDALFSFFSPRLSSRRTRSPEATSVPHAFLFTGPKGLGKTSAARILAKIVNCEKRKKAGIEPCNKCNSCVSITQGSNLDVLEIDGASNRGIDEIRELRDKIKLAPFSAKMKVYIIDEVHMLTTEAFNALLKTLEEPPAHAMFILATTEEQKLPETIISRCFHMPFHKATEDELLRSFKRIVRSEKIKIDNGVLSKIAQLSDGSFRDGVKLLEGLVAHTGKKQITEKLFEQIHNSASIRNKLGKFLLFLVKRDGKGAITLLNESLSQNMNPKIFADELLQIIHGSLLMKIGVKNAKAELELDLTVDELKKLAIIFSQKALEIKYASIAQLPLELGVIEWCLNHQDALLGSPPLASPAKIAKTTHSPNDNILEELIKRVKPYNHSVAGVLRGCKLLGYDGKKLILEAAYKFHKDRLDEEKAQELIAKVVSEITGNKVNISVILKGT